MQQELEDLDLSIQKTSPDFDNEEEIETLESKKNFGLVIPASESPSIQGCSTVPPSPEKFSLTRSIRSESSSALNLLPYAVEIAKGPEQEPESLVSILQAIINQEKKIHSRFVICVKELMQLDTQSLQSILMMTRNRLVLPHKNQSILRSYLEEMTKNVNYTIDYLRSYELSCNDDNPNTDINEDKDIHETKEMVEYSIAAISVLEKLLFPKMKPSFYDNLKEINDLKDFLEKIKSSYLNDPEIEPREMQRAPSTSNFQLFKSGVRLDDGATTSQRTKCCCRVS